MRVLGAAQFFGEKFGHGFSPINADRFLGLPSKRASLSSMVSNGSCVFFSAAGLAFGSHGIGRERNVPRLHSFSRVQCRLAAAELRSAWTGEDDRLSMELGWLVLVGADVDFVVLGAGVAGKIYGAHDVLA